MIFLARSSSPRTRRFASPEQHLIKGLNVETMADVFFPSPSWITTPEYSDLQTLMNTETRELSLYKRWYQTQTKILPTRDHLLHHPNMRILHHKREMKKKNLHLLLAQILNSLQRKLQSHIVPRILPKSI